MEIPQLIIHYLNKLREYYKDKVFLLKYVFYNQEIFLNYFLNLINFQIKYYAILSVMILK